MLAQHPGKRTLLSVQQILFTDNQPPLPPSDCSLTPSPCSFILSGACPSSPHGLAVFFVNTVAKTKVWIPTCMQCGIDLCAPDLQRAMRNLTCAELDALKNVTAFDCSMLPNHQQTQALITEQELLSYWKDIPWGRYYDGAEPQQATISAQSPQNCVVSLNATHLSNYAD